MLQDLRYAFRQLRRRPGFALAVVLTLSLGIGANAAIYSVLDALILRPLAVSDPDRLVTIRATRLDGSAREAVFGGFLPISHPDFEDLRRDNPAFAGMYEHHATEVTVQRGERPERVWGEFVSGSYFDVLGVRPEAGRFFRPQEDLTPSSHPVAVLAHAFWARELGADAEVIGRTIRVNGNPVTVVGIGPRGFHGTNRTIPVSVWLPTMMFERVAQAPLNQLLDVRGARMFFAVGRLARGVTLDRARVELEARASRLASEYPRLNRNRGVTLHPLQSATVGLADRSRYVRSGLVLMGLVGLVLLIACTNVGNLLLMRGVGRRREMSIRLALGARPRRLLRQLATEHALLALLGGVGGLWVAVAGSSVLWAFRPPELSGDGIAVGLDGRLLAFVAAISVLTGVLFGLAPAIRLTRRRLMGLLVQRGGVSGRTRSGPLRPLIIGQVAFCVVALAAAGLFLRSLHEARCLDFGFSLDGVAAVTVHPAEQGWEEPRVRDFYRRAVETVAALPGVDAAAVSEVRPFSTTFLRSTYREDEDPDTTDGRLSQTNIVGPRYFETLGMPILAGRSFTDGDGPDGALVAVVNESAAAVLWPDEEPVGRRMKMGSSDESILIDVVGLVGDARYLGVGDESIPYIYFPLEQWFAPAATIVARGGGESRALLASAQAALTELEPSIPLVRPQTGEALVDEALWAPRTGAALITVFGALALALVVVGLWGVTAFSVGQRTREIAIRIAIGAPPARAIRDVVLQVMTNVAIGIVLGVGLTLALVPAAAGLLVGVAPSDPRTLVGAPAVMALVALVAAWLPARGAGKVDPVEPLRTA